MSKASNPPILAIRLPPMDRVALERAARADDRPVSTLARKIIVGVATRAESVGREMSVLSPSVKRLFDAVVAAILGVVTLPVLIVIAVVMKLDSKGPIIFVQSRRGLNGSTFKMFKFRTMYVNVQDDVAFEQTKRGDPRITRFGSFLRRSSLDELPQIFNVLRGDMSLVGPRPHALGTHIGGRTLPEICSQYMLRYAMRPGITGWAQVNGHRGALVKEQDLISRVNYDMFYLKNATLALDLRIIVTTAMMVFRDRNAF